MRPTRTAMLAVLLAALHCTCPDAVLTSALAADALPEREAHPRAFRGLVSVIGHLAGGAEGVMADAIRWEALVLTELGYKVGINKPYAGGFITEHYGRPARGLHALQIEVNRSLYMDEKTLERHAGMDKLIADLGLLTGRLTALPVEVLSPLSGRFAAE